MHISYTRFPVCCTRAQGTSRPYTVTVSGVEFQPEECRGGETASRECGYATSGPDAFLIPVLPLVFGERGMAKPPKKAFTIFFYSILSFFPGLPSVFFAFPHFPLAHYFRTAVAGELLLYRATFFSMSAHAFDSLPWVIVALRCQLSSSRPIFVVPGSR